MFDSIWTELTPFYRKLSFSLQGASDVKNLLLILVKQDKKLKYIQLIDFLEDEANLNDQKLNQHFRLK